MRNVGWKPAVPARTWGWTVATVPERVLNLWQNSNAAIVEDMFSPGEGGAWSWYPLAGTWRHRHLSRRWHIAGRGAAVIGTVERIEDRVRFIPSVFWQHRDFSDWMVTVTGEDHDKRWLRLTTPAGTVVLRQRRSS